MSVNIKAVDYRGETIELRKAQPIRAKVGGKEYLLVTHKGNLYEYRSGQFIITLSGTPQENMSQIMKHTSPEYFHMIMDRVGILNDIEEKDWRKLYNDAEIEVVVE